jgi:hypothetical protein
MYIVVFCSLMIFAFLGVTGIAGRISRRADGLWIVEEKPTHIFGWFIFILLNSVLFFTHFIDIVFSFIKEFFFYAISQSGDIHLGKNKRKNHAPSVPVISDDTPFDQEDIVKIKDEVMRENWEKEKVPPASKRPADMPWRLSKVEDEPPQEKKS